MRIYAIIRTRRRRRRRPGNIAGVEIGVSAARTRERERDGVRRCMVTGVRERGVRERARRGARVATGIRDGRRTVKFCMDDVKAATGAACFFENIFEKKSRTVRPIAGNALNNAGAMAVKKPPRKLNLAGMQSLSS